MSLEKGPSIKFETLIWNFVFPDWVLKVVFDCMICFIERNSKWFELLDIAALSEQVVYCSIVEVILYVKSDHFSVLFLVVFITVKMINVFFVSHPLIIKVVHFNWYNLRYSFKIIESTLTILLISHFDTTIKIDSIVCDLGFILSSQFYITGKLTSLSPSFDWSHFTFFCLLKLKAILNIFFNHF